jgi:hypothetical protein
MLKKSALSTVLHLTSHLESSVAYSLHSDLRTTCGWRARNVHTLTTADSTLVHGGTVRSVDSGTTAVETFVGTDLITTTVTEPPKTNNDTVSFKNFAFLRTVEQVFAWAIAFMVKLVRYDML